MFRKKRAKGLQTATTEAHFQQGEKHYYGRGIPQNYAKAAECYQEAAKRGDAIAQFNLGLMYAKGEGVEKNQQLAAHWYRKAAEQGHAGAQFNLGLMYEDGTGVEKNQQLAVQWYRKAAEQEDAGAQYNLGFMYAKGEGVEKNQQLAVQWYRKAAEQGYVGAQYNLGFRYASGTGVEKNQQLAVQWYRKAAEQGNEYAQQALKRIQPKQTTSKAAETRSPLTKEAPAKPTPSSSATSRKTGRVAALASQWGAQTKQPMRNTQHKPPSSPSTPPVSNATASANYEQGEKHYHGRGVPADHEKAAEYYRKAAEQGHAGAQYSLGFMYINGLGMEKDDDKQALGWYQRAAEQGHAQAQCNLGAMYEHGQGASQDNTQAVAWYRKAAGQGHAVAQLNLGFMYADGRGVTKDKNLAVDCYRKAAKLGGASINFNLGLMYEDGNGVEKTPRLAVDWYRKAAEQGHARAQQALKRIQSKQTTPKTTKAQPPIAKKSPAKPVTPSSASPRKTGRVAALASQWGAQLKQPISSASQRKLPPTSTKPSLPLPSARPQPATKRRSAPGPTPSTALTSSSFEINYAQITQINQGAPLGQGAFGIVYRAQWQYQPVAVKTLSVSKLTSRDEQEFRSEVAINAGLRHPNITTFYGACTQSPHYCLVMEYMPKGSLYTLLHNTPPSQITWEQRYTWARDIGAGLAYLHSQNMLHRDLKSLNVLLDDRLRAKLADFGLTSTKQHAQVTSSLGSVSHNKRLTSAIHLGQAGTNRWKAPELFKRRAKHTQASDVYAYGCILWEMASHKVPFEDERNANDGMIAMWVREGERDDIPDKTPPQYGQLISRCWAQRVTERPTVAQAMHTLTQASVSPERVSSAPRYESALDSMRSGPDYDSVGASQMSRR